MTRKQMSYVRSLRQSKFRRIHGQFVAEGPKIVEELIDIEVGRIKADEYPAFRDKLLLLNQSEKMELLLLPVGADVKPVTEEKKGGVQ